MYESGQPTDKALHGVWRRRALRLIGLLTRPELSPPVQARLAHLLDTADFLPLSAVPGLLPLLPLIQAHLESIGRGRTNLLAGAPPTPDSGAAAVTYYSRRLLLQESLALIAKATGSRILLLKGAALAPLYPAPALRPMSDADLVLEPGALSSAAAALRAAGWSLLGHDVSLVARHRGGFHLDLQCAQTPLGRAIMQRAVRHPHYTGEVFMPRPADHALYIAWHGTQHGGLRLWRDACDLHLLFSLEPGNERKMAVEALALGVEHDPRAVASLSAFLRFMNRHSPLAARVPVRAPGWTPSMERMARERLALFEHLALSPHPPALFDLLRIFSPAEWLHRLIHREAGGRSHPPRTHGWRELDPALGLLPRAGTRERVALRLRLILGLIRQGRFLETVRRARQIATLADSDLHFSGLSKGKPL